MRWFAACFLICLDAVTKFFALHLIPVFRGASYPFGGIGVFSDFLGISFSLNLVGNTGTAWGLFSGNAQILFFLRLFIILGFGLALYVFDRPMLKKIPVMLVGAGAIGNAIDYILYGHVVDFFHFVLWGYSFPVFNFADIYISCGAAFFLFMKRRPKHVADL